MIFQSLILSVFKSTQNDGLRLMMRVYVLIELLVFLVWWPIIYLHQRSIYLDLQGESKATCFFKYPDKS